MTLGDFLNVCEGNQPLILFFLIALPLTTLLAGIFGKGEGHKSPWKYLYMTLLYLAVVPGVFVITLNLYLLIFENASILDANIYTQILPIACMLLTLWLIKWNVSFNLIPGFDKISGLIFILILLISLLWVLEKTNIFIISFMPFHYFVLFFILILIGIRYGLKKVF